MAASELQEIPLKEELNNKETHIQVVENLEHEEEHNVRFNYDPYPKRTLSELIGRKYLIYQNVAFNTTEFIRPFDELLSVPQIQRCLQGFRYFRADMNVEILLTANKNVYGTVLVSTLPYLDPIDNGRSDVTRQLQSEPHLLDISKQEGLTLYLPYVNLLRYVDLDDTDPFKQWRIQISTIAIDTLVTDVDSTFEVEIWANFEKSETALFTDAVFQSKTQSMTRHSNPFVNVVSAVNALGQYMPDINTVGKYFPDASTLFSQAAASVPKATAAAATATSVGSLAYQTTKLGLKAAGSLNPKGPSEQIKSQVCPDLNGTSATALNFLGDPVRGAKKDLPIIRNLYDLDQIVSTPAYLDTYTLSTVADDFTVDCNPNLPGSYFGYFMRMFKYYRTDVKVMIRFSTAPDVTAKLAVKVLPTGLASDHYGDLPFWEISMKGTTNFCCVVPYLENSHWLETYESVQSKVHVSLMRDLPKIYDKTPKVFAHVFLAPVSCRLASLQSPCNPTAQCTFQEAFSEVHTFGSSYQSEFLHSYNDVFELLNRYSTRDVDSALPIYPFPHVINSEMFKYDIFDYVAQLYMFYTGSMDVKYLCEGVAPGTLKMVVGNSNSATIHGNSFRSGNSMSLTSQAVWPVLEINFPFEQVVEFNSLKDPLPSYVPEINLPESVTEVFVRPGPDFTFLTLMPTPDWADDIEAVFQSSTVRMFNQAIYSGMMGVSSGVSSVGLTNFPTGTSTVTIQGYITRSSGTTDCNASIAIGPTNSATDIYDNVRSSYLGGVFPWIDVTNSGKNYVPFFFQRCMSGYSGSFWLRFTTDSPASTFQVRYTVTCVPFYQTIMPISPDSGYCDVLLSSGQTISVNEPIDVVLTSSTLSSPLQVHDSGTVKVDLDTITTQDTLNVTGTLEVSNAPLWVSTYKPQ